MAKGWVRALNEALELKGRVRLVGLVDVSLPAAEALKAEFGLTDAVTGTDLDAVLTRTKPEMVFDVAIPQARRDLVLTATKHGCHVLTEKPMATSLDNARAQIAAAKAAGKVYAVVQNRRFVDGVRRIRAAIDSGMIGELTALHADFFVGAHFGGFREEMQNVLLLDMAIHTLDAARFMAGADPLAVYAFETNPHASWYAHGAAANAIFEMSNDVVFTYRGSWVAEGARTSWESQWRIVGTTGTLLWDGYERFDAQVVAGSDGLLRPFRDVAVPPPPHPAQTHGHASVLAEFLDAIENGRTPETAGQDNIKSLAMVFGAIESARTKSRVVIAA
jgi:predicted dehydrogenase